MGVMPRSLVRLITKSLPYNSSHGLKKGECAMGNALCSVFLMDFRMRLSRGNT